MGFQSQFACAFSTEDKFQRKSCCIFKMPPVTNHARPIAVPRRSPSKGVKAISSAGSRIEDAASIRPKSASVAAAGDGKKLVKRRPIVSASLTDGNNGPHVDAQAVTNAIDTKPTVVTNGKKKINRSTALARVKPVMSTDGTCATIDGSAAALIEASGNDGPSPTKNTVEGKMPTKVAGSNARSDTKRVKPRPTTTSVTINRRSSWSITTRVVMDQLLLPLKQMGAKLLRTRRLLHLGLRHLIVALNLLSLMLKTTLNPTYIRLTMLSLRGQLDVGLIGWLAVGLRRPARQQSITTVLQCINLEIDLSTCLWQTIRLH